MEKRRSKRYARHFSVHYGQDDFGHTAFTRDVSAGGLFIVTSSVLPVQTRLQLEVFVEAARCLYFEGQVVRQMVVAPALRQVVKGGMGVRFLTPAELFPELVPQRATPAPSMPATPVPRQRPNGLSFPTREAYAEAFARELRRGGAFIHVDRQLPPGSRFLLELELAWANRVLRLPCTVTHVVPGASSTGVTLMFDEPGRAQAELTEALNA